MLLAKAELKYPAVKKPTVKAAMLHGKTRPLSPDGNLPHHRILNHANIEYIIIYRIASIFSIFI